MKRSLWIFLAAVCVGCSSSNDDTVDEQVGTDNSADELVAALSTITYDNLNAHLNYLAADERRGRFTGSPEYLESAEYVARQFDAIGLTPAGTDGWFQPVPFLANKHDVENSGMVVHADGNDHGLAWKDDYVMSGDKVRPTTTVRAEVVFAGFGVHAPELGYSDYGNVDVSGKIVAIFDGSPASFPHNERAYFSSGRTKAEEAARRGAVGTIGLRSRAGQKRVPWPRITLNAGVIPGMSWLSPAGDASGYHPELQGRATLSVASAEELFDGTLLSFEESLDAADDGKPLTTPLGVEVTITQISDHVEASSPNVIAILPGSDPQLKNEYIIYSAHLDHVGVAAPVDGDSIYNGFFDNAMGSALLIETARAMAALPVAPKRSIIFIAVTGEERGLLGSEYFTKYPTVDIDSIVANVNLDMPLLLFPIADTVAFGAEHSSLKQPIAQAVAQEGFELSPDPTPEEVRFVRSDQYSFVRQGIPSVFLVPGSKSLDPQIDGEAIVFDHRQNHYHKPSDDLSRPVDWDSALRFARANVRIGLAVAAEEQRPTWNTGDFFGDKFRRP